MDNLNEAYDNQRSTELFAEEKYACCKQEANAMVEDIATARLCRL